MSKKFLKRLIWLGLVAILSLTGLAVLNGVAALQTYFQQGADPATALNIVPNKPPDLNVSLTWQPDPVDTGRVMEDFNRQQIEAAYLRAWLQWNISYARNEPYGLKTYFVGPALTGVSSAVTATKDQNWHIIQADTSHDLRLNFYSADGSVAAFTDQTALVARTIQDSKGNLLSTGESADSYEVVMFLEDGNWRVRHWLRTNSQDYNQPLPAAQQRAGFVSVKEDKLYLNGQAYKLAGVNYYPQATPWDKFWLRYNPDVIEHDFGLIETLGLNTVRIFVPFEQFGGAHIPTEVPISQSSVPVTPTVTTKLQVEEPLKKLTDLLTRADQHHLKVIVTLFDFRTDYSLLLWPQADRHLETLLIAFKDNPAILAWDLKNEPDLDYRHFPPALVNAWLNHMAQLARHYDPAHLLTIGWSTPRQAPTLADKLDFVSFHYYGDSASFAGQYQTLQKATSGKAIVLSEFGLSTWNSFLLPGGHSEPEQAEYYATILQTLRDQKNAGYLAWDLYDYNAIPAGVAGGLPWQSGPQKEFGLLKANGAPKAAAVLLAPGTNLQVSHVPFWAVVLKPFWFTLVGLICLALLAFIAKKRGLLKFLGRLPRFSK